MWTIIITITEQTILNAAIPIQLVGQGTREAFESFIGVVALCFRFISEGEFGLVRLVAGQMALLASWPTLISQ